jgi:hypothetical protein
LKDGSAIAAWYAHPPPIPQAVLRAAAASAVADDAAVAEAEAHRASPDSVHSLVAHVLLPAFKAGLLPPRKLASNPHVVQVASAEKRAFSRAGAHACAAATRSLSPSPDRPSEKNSLHSV